MYRALLRLAAGVVAGELRKPETQAKIAGAVAAASATLRDPEKRAEMQNTAGAAGKSAARALGRAAGTLRNKLSGPPD
jgi:hypothetical protein